MTVTSDWPLASKDTDPPSPEGSLPSPESHAHSKGGTTSTSPATRTPRDAGNTAGIAPATQTMARAGGCRIRLSERG